MDLVHFRAVCPSGRETLLDPLAAEALFWVKWRRLPVRLVPSSYLRIKALGPLPAALDEATGGFVPRAGLLAAVAALPPGAGEAAAAVDGAAAAEDAAFCDLVRARIGEAVEFLLYGDDGIWEDYTRPVLSSSAPSGFAWAMALHERAIRRGTGWFSAAESAAAQRRAAALLGLEEALDALSDRLGDQDCFGSRRAEGGGASEAAAAGAEASALVALDACAYGHLAVLFSIPCQSGSRLGAILTRHGTLSRFCDRMELWLRGVWPDPTTFLVAVDAAQRLPSALAAASGAATAGSTAPPPTGKAEALHWWELWGWSWREEGRLRPVPPKVRKNGPPAWYPAAFVSVGALSAAAVYRTYAAMLAARLAGR